MVYCRHMNEIIRNIDSLTTTRSSNFSDEKISDENLEIIVKSSIRAPNASNRQSYSILVVDEEQKKRLGLRGDRVLLYMIDFYRHECLKEYIKANISFDHFQPFLTGVIDVSLAVQNAVIAAHSLKIAYLITNDTYSRDLGEIFELFNLPKKGCFPLIYLCLGYAKEKTVTRKSRIALEHIVHYGRYRNYAKDEIGSIVDEYDHAELELFSGWKEKGYERYLDWFYKKWLPSLENREKSLKLVEIIKNSGFLDS